MIFKRRKRGMHPEGIGNHKFCPVCGHKLELHDTFCTRCGYSFHSRSKKSPKKIKWKNLLFFIIIIAIIYVSIRYFNKQPIIPSSFQDLLNFSSFKK